LEITQGCRLIGLNFESRFTTGPSVRAYNDSNLTDDEGTAYQANYVHVLECSFHGWGVGYDGFEFRGANLGLVEKCTFDAMANSGCGVAFRGSGTNNPVRNQVKECRFTNVTHGIAVRSATPQDNILGPDNIFKDITTDAIHSNGGAGDAFVVGNYFEVDKDNAYDQALADMLTSGWTFAGNNYIES
jgi:hypothetical protein